MRTHFPTVAGIDTWAGRMPGRIETIGFSRSGRPLRMVTIGEGDRHAVVIGMPHPNEPVGTLAIFRLIEQLAAVKELRAGLVWHFLPCMDPDGAVLNEGWFDGPFDQVNYARHLYRPPFDEQFEWTFQLPGAAEPGLSPTPESQAVMDFLDALRPELLVSMHNAEVGGFYCYVTDPAPRLDLSGIRAATGIPYHLGETEVPAARLSHGVFHSPPNLSGGAMISSTDYAAQFGTFGVTSEPPLWTDPGAEDESPADISYESAARLFRIGRSALAAIHGRWYETIAAEVDMTSARGRAVIANAKSLSVQWTPVGGDHCSGCVACVSGLTRGLTLERLRSAGHIVALLQDIPRTPALTDVLTEAEAQLHTWAVAAPPFVGLTTAIDCHVALALAAAKALADL